MREIRRYNKELTGAGKSNSNGASREQMNVDEGGQGAGCSCCSVM